MTTETNPALEGEHAAAQNAENILNQEALTESEARMEDTFRGAEEMRKIEDLKQGIMEASGTPFENVSISPEGKLIEGTPFTPVMEPKKEGMKLPSWLKKTAKVLGITSVGLLAPNQAHAGQAQAEGGNAGSRTEIVASQEHGQELSVEVKSAWDQYVSWLGQKGLKGSPELDKGTKGIEMLQQFVQEHPGTPLSLDLVVDIQNYFKEYREWLIKEVLAKRVVLEGNITIEQLMERLSDKDGYPGSWTTSHLFPKDKTITYAHAVKIQNNTYMKIGGISDRK